MLRITILALIAAFTAAAEPVANEPIQRVETGANGELRVNGKPFFPIMSWLQSTSRFEQLKSVGINTFVGNHQNKPPADKFADLAAKAGGYAIPHFGEAGIGHPAILGWIQGDEPDLPRQVNDAKVTWPEALHINGRCPLWKLYDGVNTSWSVLDPMDGASVTIALPEPATAVRLAVWVTAAANDGMTLPSEVAFIGDGKELGRLKLERKRGQQALELPAPATFSALELKVVAVHPGKQVWGSLSEIEAFDAAGKNVLLNPPRMVTRATPEQVAALYKDIKAKDPSRPVFMTFTAGFMPEYCRLSAEQRAQYYPEYVKAADVLGFDLYPIYGWNRPDWITRVADGAARLSELAGPRKPTYQWIETCKGGQYIDYAKQYPVLPEHTRAEVWMAVIAGAKGIGYFTHAWKPAFSEFNCTEDMQKELTRLNAQLTRLAPVILAPPAKVAVSLDLGESRSHVMATDDGKRLTLFAQGLEPGKALATGTIEVAGLAKGTLVTVIDEPDELTGANREIIAGDGQFTDTFISMTEHIYQIPSPAR